MLPTNLEVNSYEFDQYNPKLIVKTSDLDEDQTPDQLIFRYWSTWDNVAFDVESSVNGYLNMSLGCDRLSILSSETNGMKD